MAVLATGLAVGALANDAARSLQNDIGQMYATDAYPGFDSEDEILKPSKKTPRWFAFINGPKMTNAAEQLAWCQECEREQAWGKARSGYDALVREWPAAPEAPRAQQRLAELELEDLDVIQAFEEYRYLVDFYPTQCDYDAMVHRLYAVAEMMREEGKRIFFIRFDNTIDVRRAYESVVLRAPGADFVPQALLTIGALREDEGKFDQAIEVYGNLRNLYVGTKEAEQGLLAEARVRMQMLDEHGYNRDRVRDTIEFLRLAVRGDVGNDSRETLRGYLVQAERLRDDAAYEAAKFYDSRTRTRRSAINAYETYIGDFPDGIHVDEARSRLNELKED